MRSLLAFVLFIYVADCTQFRADYNYHSDIKGWLKLHQIPAKFHDAWFRCHLEGAVLASPSNILIESAMLKEMSNKPVSTGGIFTGIHATYAKGYFYSVDGIPLDNMRLNWMPNEPDNKNYDEDCILYNKTIADIGCSEIHPYICYKEDKPNMVVTKCGTVDPEYNLDTRTGKCYKFHKLSLNWTLAFMTCSAEGGHLAVINSVTEANALKELFEKIPGMSIKHADLNYFLHLGFQDWNEMGIWTTIHGTSLKEAGFEVWGDKQPNNPEEHCGSMPTRPSELHDMPCKKLMPFICEKDPKSLQYY